MTTLAQLRKTALSFPETAEHRIRTGEIEFTVRDKVFASTHKDGRAHLHLGESDADSVLSRHPTAERLMTDGVPVGVRVPFQDINGMQLNHWVRRAWLLRAPKELAHEREAADSMASGEVGDLPKALGRSATRALAAAGITSLDLAATRTEAELLELHGMGPKAMRVLHQALSETGRSIPG